MVTLEGIDGRIERLAELAQGLSRETATFGKVCAGLADHERRDYLNSVMDALAAADQAKHALKRVRERFERNERR